MTVNGLRQAAFALALLGMSGTAIAEPMPETDPVLSAESVRPRNDSVPKPVQMLRTLQLMQDQIAVGSTEAHIGQRGLLTILNTRFIGLGPDVWTDRRNVRAAIAFVLSGGSPQILRKLLEMGNPALALEDRAIVEGTLAYVEGREEEAKSKLMALDLAALPPMLAAQLALVQSALFVRTDAKRSSELLDYVRLQAPGTLLEEGALRRQVFVASQTGDMDKFLALTSNYLRRYRHSVYAGNFRQRLASALTRIDFGNDQVLFEGIVEVLKDLEREVRRDLYLLAARSSIEQGHTTSARMLADEARKLSDGDTTSATRAKLYRAAAMIVAPEAIDAAVADLESIDRSVLLESDAILLHSALSIAAQIRQMPSGQIAKSQKPSVPDTVIPAAPARIADARQAPEQLETLSKVRNSLSRIDKLIKQQTPTVQ
ncbi:chemotaxis protein MotC [Microvirga makkahensis]|uniref:Chemotaxis protein MotC n=1 Tax=Microvirga makkahensis TaxID=1128670 RepID=A0A7X3MR18_9HYPH|nr:chemotaxis protein MotC [Microvirga makkahensis]MXQ11663.1 chemotaxis protein MotC [Microvirga makkahensis]